MKYIRTKTAIFRERPNRFIANVEVDGTVQAVHVKNTGRCRELLIPGARVVLSIPDNPDRKTKYDLVGVYREGLGLVNIDSQAPNQVVKEWLENPPKALEIFPDITYLKPEYTYGKSRIDFYFERGEKKALMEVKGVTLEREGIAYFPDAPTQRGIKHMEELIHAAEEGYETYLAFVIQMEGVNEVRANINTHPKFGEILEKAKKKGVTLFMLGCKVKEQELRIDRVTCVKEEA